MSKYLLLNFRNAKLFRKFNKDKKNYSTKDYVFYPYGNYETGGYDKRDDYPAFVEPITVYQISNMLHVLFNERPVPSIRKGCVYPRIEYYFNKANASYLKIDTPKNNVINGVPHYYFETTQTKKAVYNSWNKSSSISWEIVKRYIGNEEMFQLFVNKLNEILKTNTRLIPIISVRNMVRNLNNEELKSFYAFIENKMTGRTGFNYFFGITETGKLTKPDNSKLTDNCERTGRTVNNGLDTIVMLSGQIIIPVSDDDILKLEQHTKGYANILDNGLVWIDSLINDYELNLYNFTPVSEISTEMTKPFNTK